MGDCRSNCTESSPKEKRERLPGSSGVDSLNSLMLKAALKLLSDEADTSQSGRDAKSIGRTLKHFTVPPSSFSARISAHVRCNSVRESSTHHGPGWINTVNPAPTVKKDEGGAGMLKKLVRVDVVDVGSGAVCSPIAVPSRRGGGGVVVASGRDD